MTHQITKFLSIASGRLEFIAHATANDGVTYASGLYGSREAAKADKAQLFAKAEAERAAA